MRGRGAGATRAPLETRKKKWHSCCLSRTEPNKQRQELNLYGRSIQMAGDLRKWQIHTLTDHLVFSFQAKVFITGNKPGAASGFEGQGGLGERDCSIPVLGR